MLGARQVLCFRYNRFGVLGTARKHGWKFRRVKSVPLIYLDWNLKNVDCFLQFLFNFVAYALESINSLPSIHTETKCVGSKETMAQSIGAKTNVWNVWNVIFMCIVDLDMPDASIKACWSHIPSKHFANALFQNHIYFVQVLPSQIIPFLCNKLILISISLTTYSLYL